MEEGKREGEREGRKGIKGGRDEGIKEDWTK